MSAVVPVDSSVKRRVLVIATDAVDGVGLIDELGGGRPADEVEAAVVAPVVEHSAVKHAVGDLEPAREHARRRLEARLGELRSHGIRAFGMVGDTDPLLAAQDALQGFAADEVLIFERAGDQARWFEDGLFERAQETLRPPIRMVTVEAEGERPEPVAEESVPAGTEAALERHDVELSPYLPRFERGDLAAIAIGIAGTIAAIVFFAAGPGTQTGVGAAQGIVALAAGLVNLGHVIGLTLFESVRYRGFFRGFFRTVTLTFTPLAALANLILWLAS